VSDYTERLRAAQEAAAKATREHPDDDWAAFQALRMEIDNGKEPTP
jgi:hypothetical protein